MYVNTHVYITIYIYIFFFFKIISDSLVLLYLAEPPGLTLGLEEGEDVVLPDGADNVADDGARLVVEELNADLGDGTTGASAAENLGHLSELDWGVLHTKK